MQRQSALLQPTPRFTLPARAICERWVRYTRRESSGEWMCVGWLANTSQEQDRGAGATRTCLGWSRSNIPGCCTDFRVRVRCGDTRRFATQMGSSAMSARLHVCVETCLAVAQVSPVKVSRPMRLRVFLIVFHGFLVVVALQTSHQHSFGTLILCLQSVTAGERWGVAIAKRVKSA